MRINVRADSITVGCLGWNSTISHRVPPPHLLWKASWILQKKIQSRPEHTRYQSLGHLWKVKVLSQAQGCSPGLFMWQGLFKYSVKSRWLEAGCPGEFRCLHVKFLTPTSLRIPLQYMGCSLPSQPTWAENLFANPASGLCNLGREAPSSWVSTKQIQSK